MTKKQCKNKIANLEDRIDRMQEQIIHYRRQVKVLDAEDSKRLLEKFHIESEELAELLMNRGKKPRTEAEPEKQKQKTDQKEPQLGQKEPQQEQQESQSMQQEIDSLQQEPESVPEEGRTSIMVAFRKEAEQ